jgi:hypothetical protein
MQRAGRLGRHSAAVIVAAAVVLVLLGTVAYAAVLPTRGDVAKQLAQRRGKIKITNSLGRKPIVGKLGMAPGERVSGTVTIGNASRVRANFFLGLSKLVEAPGAGGGHLSYRLVLTVKRVYPNRRPQLVWTGPLRQMPMVKLGKFLPREKRTYSFIVLFPAGGTSADGRFVRASTSLDFNWYARRAR